MQKKKKVVLSDCVARESKYCMHTFEGLFTLCAHRIHSGLLLFFFFLITSKGEYNSCEVEDSISFISEWGGCLSV